MQENDSISATSYRNEEAETKDLMLKNYVTTDLIKSNQIRKFLFRIYQENRILLFFSDEFLLTLASNATI